MERYLFSLLSIRKQKRNLFSIERDRFLYPVFIDEKGGFDALNHFLGCELSNFPFGQSEQGEIAIGNPVHNKKVRDLYLQIITGQQTGVATSSQTKSGFG